MTSSRFSPTDDRLRFAEVSPCAARGGAAPRVSLGHVPADSHVLTSGGRGGVAPGDTVRSVEDGPVDAVAIVNACSGRAYGREADGSIHALGAASTTDPAKPQTLTEEAS